MNFFLIDALLRGGGDWVIDILLFCSVLAVGVILEGIIRLRREGNLFNQMKGAFTQSLGREKSEILRALERSPGAASRILAKAVSGADCGPEGVADILAAAGAQEKNFLEKRLLILGTLGNNAPFIGLLGTVLGVIRAFNDLSNAGAGPEAVMKGLSDALVSTAVGLLVAIPCVIFYNYLSKEVRDLLSETESLGRRFIARLRRR